MRAPISLGNWIPVVKQFRPKYFSYAYPLPVDWVLPTARIVVFDIARRKQIDVAARPLTQLYYGGSSVETS